jgi:predicted transcriptional regulator
MNPTATLTGEESKATKPTPLSLKLSATSRQRLRDLAERQRRPAHALAREAIEAYIEQEETRIQRNEEADAAWKHYQDTGLHVDGQDAIAWLRSLSTATPLPNPQARCEK